MAVEYINSSKSIKPRVPLSHATKVGNLIFVSGTTPFVQDRYEVVSNDFEAQMRQVMANIIEILEEAGSSLAKVAKVNVFLEHEKDFAKMNEIYREYFRDPHLPARTTVGVKMANRTFLIEIEVIAEA